MPEKQKTRTWKDPKTVIAAISITGLLSLWNAFATHDRQNDQNVDTSTPTPFTTHQATVDTVCSPPIQMNKIGKKCEPVTHTRSS